MYLTHLHIRNHPILKDFNLELINPKTGKPYSVIAFVGENGCGKTTLLNEIFEYTDSKYIVDKEKKLSFDLSNYSALYLRQGSLFRSAMSEIGKLIDGKDRYPTKSKGYENYLLSDGNALTNKETGIKVLEELGDDSIIQIFKDDHLDEVHCSGDVSLVIDGKKHGYEVSTYSSGQQEILLKLRDIKRMASGTDSILLDEPETSLHPRWQKQIVPLIKEIVASDNPPQIFLATHSEKVLETLIKDEDTLIIRLFKNNGVIQNECIGEMDLCLPTPTFAELDYVVFHIPSMDYHDQLLTQIANLYSVETISEIDKTIRKHSLYSKQDYGKVWIGASKNAVIKFNTLPVYIRNYFHHPKDGMAPTDDEIIKSILFLRRIIKEFVL